MEYNPTPDVCTHQASDIITHPAPGNTTGITGGRSGKRSLLNLSREVRTLEAYAKCHILEIWAAMGTCMWYIYIYNIH